LQRKELQRNNTGAEGTRSLAAALDTNRTLQTLDRRGRRRRGQLGRQVARRGRGAGHEVTLVGAGVDAAVGLGVKLLVAAPDNEAVMSQRKAGRSLPAERNNPEREVCRPRGRLALEGAARRRLDRRSFI
jgi:hypothetical protein